MFAVKEGKTSRVVVSLYTSLSTPRLFLSHVVVLCFTIRKLEREDGKEARGKRFTSYSSSLGAP